jgi:hypothetical protein
MSRKFKSIGLALMVVCAVGAVSAGAAQAAPSWTIGSTGFTGTETVSVTPKTSLLLTVPAVGLTISCTGLSAPGAEISGGNIDRVTSLKFTSCTVPGSPGCEVLNLHGTGGTIETPGVESELVTVGGVVYDIFTPAEPPTIVTIVVRKTGMGSCALATGAAGAQVRGTVGASVANGATGLLGASSEAIQMASGRGLTFGSNPAYLDGKIEFKPSGANVGQVLGFTS